MSAPKRNDVKEETPENTRVSRRRLVPLNQTERQAGEPASSSEAIVGQGLLCRHDGTTRPERHQLTPTSQARILAGVSVLCLMDEKPDSRSVTGPR